MARILASLTPTIAMQSGLKAIAVLVEKTAKDEMGYYQPQVGPFAAWAELAPATKEDRLAQGFTENDPLLRSGQTRDSIGHQIEGFDALIGSPEDKLLWAELGTSRAPARPVLGPAVYTNKSAIEKLAGAALLAGLVGNTQIAGLGYDYKVGP